MNLSNENLVEMYTNMLKSRRFQEYLLELCAEGRSYEGLQSSIGEEAVGVGACYGLRDDDYVLPTLRTREAFMVRGVSIRSQMAAAFGRVNGPGKGKTDSHHSGDHEKGVVWGTGIIGAQFPVAAGIALANKMRGKDNVIICFFGDGSSFEGEFHESLSFAAVKDLPVVFVCNNNIYSASMPYVESSKVENIAEHAKGYGIPGITVDGMNVISVNKSVQEAVERARKGEGPSIVECKTYRYLVHYSRGKQGLISGHIEFRPKEEIDAWKKRDAIKRLESILIKEGVLNKEKIDKIEMSIKQEIDDAIEFAESSPFPKPEEALEDLYSI